MRDKNFGSHEALVREDVSRTSSNKSFGLVFAAFFALLALSSYFFGHHGRWPFWLGLSIVFAIMAYAAPHILGPLNRWWAKFGLLLHAIVSPIILAFIFFGCIAPIGFLMRRFGNDPLRRRLEPDAKSYWLVREPPGPTPDSFKRQY
ncbi:SxtJ family membrane protein [Bradyrhizobium sp.]|uniref:SxtJ family membrane protein n=1 Tax=Bradyrhizobium sp. TaxID=376 RepID=UPI003C51869C